MKLFMCFGGAAAVADDEAAAEAAGRHRDQRGRSMSFRARFLSCKKGSGKKKPLSASQPSAKSKKRVMDADDDLYGLLGTASSSVASSAPLSSAASLDSGYSSSSSSSSARSSTASSSSVSGVLFPPAAARQRAAKRGWSSSPAAGAAAVVLCLLMVVFCGRVGATLLTSTALYLFPRLWPARTARGDDDDGVTSPESDGEEETTARKVVKDQGFLLRNRKK